MQRAMCRASPTGIILKYDNDRSHSFVNSPCWLTAMRYADPLRVVARATMALHAPFGAGIVEAFGTPARMRVSSAITASTVNSSCP
jgi:hypothetical protein